MRFLGDRNKYLSLYEQIQRLCQKNYYFSQIWSTVAISNLEVVVLGEQALLEDQYNLERSLTAFGGYYLEGVIHLFVTRYDVDDSLLARFLHELCHALLLSNPMSLSALSVMDMTFYSTVGDTFDISKPIPGSYDVKATSKLEHIHDNIPGEEIANKFSELLIGKRYDWEWKTQRIKEVDN